MDDHEIVTLATVYEIILAWSGPFEYENTTSVIPVTDSELQEAQDVTAPTS